MPLYIGYDEDGNEYYDVIVDTATGTNLAEEIKVDDGAIQSRVEPQATVSIRGTPCRKCVAVFRVGSSVQPPKLLSGSLALVP